MGRGVRACYGLGEAFSCQVGGKNRQVQQPQPRTRSGDRPVLTAPSFCAVEFRIHGHAIFGEFMYPAGYRRYWFCPLCAAALLVLPFLCRGRVAPPRGGRRVAPLCDLTTHTAHFPSSLSGLSEREPAFFLEHLLAIYDIFSPKVRYSRTHRAPYSTISMLSACNSATVKAIPGIVGLSSRLPRTVGCLRAKIWGTAARRA